MFLHSITHYIDTNTLEVSWLKEVLDSDGNISSYERVKCQNYSHEQRAEFIADTDRPEYVDLAGWVE